MAKTFSFKLPKSLRGISTDVSIEGLDVINRKLSGLTDSMHKKALRPAVREVAKVTKEIAVQYAPERTGLLKQSLRVKAKPRSRKADAKHVVGVRVQTDAGMFQGKTFYAGFQELGTKDRLTKTLAYRGRVKALHFIRRALEAFPEVKRQRYIMALRRWINKP